MTKSDAISRMNNSNLVHRKVFYNFFIIYKKWVRKLIIKDRDVILNRAKDYFKNDKERSREQARGNYRNLSEEEKNKKGERTWRKQIP